MLVVLATTNCEGRKRRRGENKAREVKEATHLTAVDSLRGGRTNSNTCYNYDGRERRRGRGKRGEEKKEPPGT